MNNNCTHCDRPLSAAPEPDAADWVVRCLDGGALNVIMLPIFKLVGWRE